MFLNAFELPESPNGIVHFPGCSRQYRADCKAGIFKIGESHILGNTLQMEILGFRCFDSELFGYPYQQWLESFFVDKDNTVSHILFKTESIANFLELMRQLTANGKAIGTQIVTAKTSKRSNDNGNYFAVEFESIDNESDRIQTLCEFVNTNINSIYAARLAGTFDRPPAKKELPPSNLEAPPNNEF